MTTLKHLRMSLRWDKIILLALILVGLNLGLYVLTRQVYLQSFEELERKVAYDNLSRAFQSLYHDVDNLNLLATDWAEWDDAYRYMADRNPAFLKANLTQRTLGELSLNIFLMVTAEGAPVLSLQHDPGQGQPAHFDSELQDYLVEQALIIFKEGGGESFAGIQHFKNRLMLLSINPVLMTDGQGPARGVLIMGRFVNSKYLSGLSFRNRMDLGLEIWPEQEVLARLDRRMAPDAGRRSLYYIAQPENEHLLNGYVLLQDFDGHFGPVLILKMPRDIYFEGKKTSWFFLLGALILSLIAAFLVYFIMDRLARAIQQQREQESKVYKLSSEFQAILDGIPDALTLVSPEGQVVWGNHAYMQTSRSILRDDQGRYLVEGDPHMEQRDLSPVVASALNTGLRAEAMEEDGEQKIRVKAFPIKDNDGHVTGVIKLAADVTDRVRMRKELEQNSRLASLGELSAGIAHEINNPNGMIQMNLGLVRDVWDDLLPILDRATAGGEDIHLGGLSHLRLIKEFPEILDEMINGTRRISGIVEDLKAFARPEAVDLDEPVDLNEVLLASERLLANQLRKSMADYVFLPGKGLPLVRGSFRQIEQVVINLIVNACQAINEPGSKIEVRTWYDVARGHVVVVVEDQGKGISIENLAKITDPFYTTRRRDGGTGLGLSVSARIAEEHGGSLKFRSQLGVGTQAELHLPAPKESKR